MPQGKSGFFGLPLLIMQGDHWLLNDIDAERLERQIQDYLKEVR